MREKRADKHEVPSWDYIYELCVQVADQIKREGYKPDVLVAISRGGWIPGRILSDLLDNPNIATIKVEYYLGIYETTDEPKITQPIPINVRGKRILLIDDIADSGKSLRLVREHLLKQGAKEVKICALYYKPWSIVTPEFCARETDAWIWFPHEIYETLKKVRAKLLKEGKSQAEIEHRLVEIGVRPGLVRKFLSWVEREGV
jgi:hypothetical protein